MNVGFVSLGCSKNLIDTEVTIGKFKEHNYKIVNDETKADIIVINTCGFIDSAKEEAINTILDMAELKKKRCKYLIAMGCLVQRYYDELKKALPEVDLWIRLDEYDHLWEKIDELVKNGESVEEEPKNKKISQMPMFNEYDFVNKTVSTGKNYAYIKIAEGCSNMCTYCAIPNIRGLYKSRKKEDIIEEAKELANSGIKEIILIAQDTTKYGIDIYGKCILAELLQELSKIEGIKWIQFLYSYPEGISDELIDVVANNPKIANYFDIPIQHISDEILKKMNRKTSKKQIEELINKIRSKIKDVTIRTTLMVGFPGETKENFEELMKFVKKTKFDRLGVFKYSKEDGTPAANFTNQVHGNTKKSRYNKIMLEQQQISNEILKNKIGKTYEVLVEDISFDGKFYIGRTMQDIPDVDGVVYISNDGRENVLNKFVNCKIIDVKDYDLIANFL